MICNINGRGLKNIEQYGQEDHQVKAWTAIKLLATNGLWFKSIQRGRFGKMKTIIEHSNMA